MANTDGAQIEGPDSEIGGGGTRAATQVHTEVCHPAIAATGSAANLSPLDARGRIGLQQAATLYLEPASEKESNGDGALTTSLRVDNAGAGPTPEPEVGKLARANTGVLWFKAQKLLPTAPLKTL